MIRIDRKSMDFAKSGLFAAFGSATQDGKKLKIEVTDDQLQTAAELALDYLTGQVFGCDVYFEKDDAA